MSIERIPIVPDERSEDGRLSNGRLDPRGYVVTCPRLIGGVGGCEGQGQWWGTPDNLPIQNPRCKNPDCPLRVRGAPGEEPPMTELDKRLLMDSLGETKVKHVD